eukprot:m.26730 g.26730  ORF g.26730 m.26730 type:complete len:336 (-) comp5883_c0_seq1:478-1485(-)
MNLKVMTERRQDGGGCGDEDGERDWIVHRFNKLVELKVTEYALQHALKKQKVMDQLILALRGDAKLFLVKKERRRKASNKDDKRKNLRDEKNGGVDHNNDLNLSCSSLTMSYVRGYRSKTNSRHHYHQSMPPSSPSSMHMSKRTSPSSCGKHCRLLFSLPEFSPKSLHLTDCFFTFLFNRVRILFRHSISEIQLRLASYERQAMTKEYVQVLACQAVERYLTISILDLIHSVEKLYYDDNDGDDDDEKDVRVMSSHSRCQSSPTHQRDHQHDRQRQHGYNFQQHWCKEQGTPHQQPHATLPHWVVSRLLKQIDQTLTPPSAQMFFLSLPSLAQQE